MKQKIENLLSKAVEVHQDNVSKGFWTPGVARCNDEIDMLILSEAFEALEADRGGKRADIEGFVKLTEEIENWAEMNFEGDEVATQKLQQFAEAFKSTIKDSVEDELADFCIRILDKVGNEIVTSEKVIGDEELTNEKIASYEKGSGLFDTLEKTETFSKFLAVIVRLYAKGESRLTLFSFANAYAESNKIDLNYHIDLKLQYNRTRAFKHGKIY